MNHLHHEHNDLLVWLSVIIAVFASYTALDLANAVTTSKGRSRLLWLLGGSIAMGVGIWSMHFIAMLAFSLPGIPIAYDIPLLLLSVLVAVIASLATLYVVSRQRLSTLTYVTASLTMGFAIAGMHYIGIASMRMAAGIHWNPLLVLASLLIAIAASFVALKIAFSLRDDKHTIRRKAAGALVMGFAISGMHYTAMTAMHIRPDPAQKIEEGQILATDGLAVAVIIATLLILGIAITGVIVDKALSRRTAMTQQMRDILESINDAFFSVDRHWRFTYVNRMAHQAIRPLLRSRPDELLGRSLWEAVPDLLGTRFESDFRLAMLREVPASFEEFFEPYHIWFEVRAYPAREGLSVYFSDVTVRKLKEQELRRAIHSRDEFLSIASHELRTPITSLKLQTQIMKRSINQKDPAAFSEEKVTKLVNVFDGQVERIIRLVDDMLDIARISTGKLTITKGPVNLGDLVTELVDRYRSLFAAQGCELILDCEAGVIGSWDSFRIEQVVANLLTNAARYAPGKPVKVSVKKEGSEAVLKVKDQGIGIAEENQKRIFQRFERAGPVAETGGLGLGLYIVRSIVEMHGGKIDLESTLGRGSTFEVRLPS
jgi:PAS domain S-box-containing protein